MNYLLNVDYLEFHASTRIHLNNYLSKGIYKFSNGLFLERVKDYGSLKESHPFCFRMKYKNDNIGYLYTKTMDLALSPGLNILVRIDNYIFYVPFFGTMLKMIVEALGLLETKIKRLDVCCDTDFDALSKFKTLYYDTFTEFKLRNKLNVTGTGRDDKTIHIGSLESKVRCISIYNKTRQLKRANKEYIRNIHQELFGPRNIYRVELRIYSKTLELKNIDIINLQDKGYLETIFNTYYDSLIQFIDIKTNERIEFIKLDNTSKRLKKSVKQISKCGGKQEKSIINFLDKQSKTKEFKGLIKELNSIRSVLIDKYELENWYLTKKQG